MTMDTLKAAHELESAGLERTQAEAIAAIANDYGRNDLVTAEYLDKRLWQHTAAIVVSVLAIASTFKIFG